MQIHRDAKIMKFFCNLVKKLWTEVFGYNVEQLSP